MYFLKEYVEDWNHAGSKARMDVESIMKSVGSTSLDFKTGGKRRYYVCSIQRMMEMKKIKNGDALLIQGPSGTGKTSLLKAMAGIYPFETVGLVEHPCVTSLFLPQRPYMPQGTLREAICYPDIDPYHPELEKILADCCLDKYLHSLDVDNDWQAILSPGELQRVAFIRILLTKPEVVFLDETTSALDEPTEYILYKTIKERLPNMIILSVGHRGTLHQFHNKQLDLAVCIV